MITVQSDLSKSTLTAPALDDILFEPEINPVDTVVTPGIQEVQINEDVEDLVETDALVLKEASLTVISGRFSPNFKFESLDPDVVTVDNQGNVTRVNDGTARILITYRNRTRLVNVTVSEEGGASTILSSEFISGSLGKHCTDNLNALLVGKDAVIAKPLYTTQDHVNRVFVRNPNAWPAGVDLTCVSPSNSTANPNWRAGVALTSRHIALAPHFAYGVGTEVWFVDENNNSVSRTVVGRINHPEYVPQSSSGLQKDIGIAVLDSDLPSSIKPCKVVSRDIKDYLVNLDRGRVPCLVLDQEEKALVSSLFNLSTNFSTYRRPLVSKQVEFYEDIILYDSGNPCFLLADLGQGVELILLSMWTYSYAGASFYSNIDVINQMIIDADVVAGVSTGYSVTEADFSGLFTNFSTVLWDFDQLNTEAWYDSSDLSNITASGGDVSQLDDLSGNGRHLTITSGNHPTTGISNVGSENGIAFNGSSDYMFADSVASAIGAGTFTMFCTYKTPTIGQMLMSLRESSGSSTRVYGGLRGSGALRTLVGSSTQTSSTSVADGTDTIYGIVVKSSNVFEHFVNGVSAGDSGVFTRLEPYNRFTIGANRLTNPASGSYSNSTLGDMIVVLGELSLSDIQKVEGRLAHKRGLTGLLPVGHPYKTNPPTV